MEVRTFLLGSVSESMPQNSVSNSDRKIEGIVEGSASTIRRCRPYDRPRCVDLASSGVRGWRFWRRWFWWHRRHQWLRWHRRRWSLRHWLCCWLRHHPLLRFRFLFLSDTFSFLLRTFLLRLPFHQLTAPDYCGGSNHNKSSIIWRDDHTFSYLFHWLGLDWNQQRR